MLEGRIRGGGTVRHQASDELRHEGLAALHIGNRLQAHARFDSSPREDFLADHRVMERARHRDRYFLAARAVRGGNADNSSPHAVAATYTGNECLHSRFTS